MVLMDHLEVGGLLDRVLGLDSVVLGKTRQCQLHPGGAVSDAALVHVCGLKSMRRGESFLIVYALMNVEVRRVSEMTTLYSVETWGPRITSIPMFPCHSRCRDMSPLSSGVSTCGMDRFQTGSVGCTSSTSCLE